MKHFIISVILIFFISGISQDVLKVKAINTLIAPTENANLFLSPKWAPDGQKIAFTSLNYRGIWIYELQNSQLSQITDEMSAGFGFSWSPNSQYILTRVSRFDDNRRVSAAKVFDVIQGKEYYLTAYRNHMPDLPKWSPENDQVFFFNGKQMEYFDISFDLVSGTSQWLCYNISDKIYLENVMTSEKNEFQPLPGGNYLNVNLSPDAVHVAFEVYGGNCFILNLQNGGLTDLGQGNYPNWSPDGKYVVYMIALDDGHRYMASDIFISDTAGNFSQNLTAEIDQIAMYPSWSPIENKIIYSTYDLGTIEVIEFDL